MFGRRVRHESAGLLPAHEAIALGCELREQAAQRRPELRKLALVHFDSHPDTWGEYAGSYHYHGSTFRRAIEEGIVDGGRLIQIGSFAGEPTDPGTKAAYQDEVTLGIEKALDPTLSIGLKGTYRTLGRTGCPLLRAAPAPDRGSRHPPNRSR